VGPGGKLVEVVAGKAAEDAALAVIDGKVSGSHEAGGAGFDFDEAESFLLRGAVPGDEVEVAGSAGGSPAAGDDGVAAATEPEEGGPLAVLAGREVLGEAGLPLGGADEGVEGRLHEIEAELEQHEASVAV
jgi:hypothetical protein